MTSVTFRDVEEADKARLLAWRNAPEIARWMYGAHEITSDEHERWWATALRDPRRRYWIIEVDGAPLTQRPDFTTWFTDDYLAPPA